MFDATSAHIYRLSGKCTSPSSYPAGGVEPPFRRRQNLPPQLKELRGEPESSIKPHQRTPPEQNPHTCTENRGHFTYSTNRASTAAPVTSPPRPRVRLAPIYLSLHAALQPITQGAGNHIKRWPCDRSARQRLNDSNVKPAKQDWTGLGYLSSSRALTRAFKCRGWRAPSR